MFFDQVSLLTAIGFSGAALGATLLAAWMTSRSDRFLLGWAAGMMLVVVGVLLFGLGTEPFNSFIQFLAFLVIITGILFIYSASWRFRTGDWQIRRAASWGAVALLLPIVAYLAGFDGVGTMLSNLSAALLLTLTARQYWIGRNEAPGPMAASAVLYGMTAFTFVLCALVLLVEQQWVLTQSPNNWAEDVNAVVSIAGVTGVGALSLALNQSRLARRHESAAMTDPLTGLLNRRALFEMHARGEVSPLVAVLICDLDRFKSINDQHGHAAGDAVLRHFAATLLRILRQSDCVARLGGEEFVAVLPGANAAQAAQVAERIRTEFSAAPAVLAGEAIECTVSIGVAVCDVQPERFDMLLGRADAALYHAKQAGRDRVSVRRLQLAA